MEKGLPRGSEVRLKTAVIASVGARIRSSVCDSDLSWAGTLPQWRGKNSFRKNRFLYPDEIFSTRKHLSH